MLKVLPGLLLLWTLGAVGQESVPPGYVYPVKDTTILKLPAGAKAAIVEFDDLECPPCSRALPMVEHTSIRYGIPVIHHDFPIWEHHPWTLDASTTARYLKATASTKLWQDYRRDVFAHQTTINSRDDLAKYTKAWFAAHNLKLPANIDPRGKYLAEVKEDRILAEKMGVPGTPAIFVVTSQKWLEILNPNLLEATVGQIMSK